MALAKKGPLRKKKLKTASPAKQEELDFSADADEDNDAEEGGKKAGRVVNIKLPPKMDARVSNLIEEFETKNRTEFVTNAVKNYIAFLNEIKQGKSLIVRDDESGEETKLHIVT